MRAAGAHDQATDLARRAADSGEFDLLLKIDRDAAERFRFGREPDRTPSPRWAWRDLGSDPAPSPDREPSTAGTAPTERRYASTGASDL